MSKSPQKISSPAYDWYPGQGLAELRETVIYKTTPFNGYVAAIPHCLLAYDGRLHLSDGFVWNLGSGPSVNNPSMVYASLAHDAFYGLMDAGELSWSERKTADEFFRNQLKEFGDGWFARNRRYLGVRWGFPIKRWWDDLLGRKPRKLRG